ncbi:asparagine synthase [Halieaceae bacterium IMCC14734]|uniref:asparagine synthase (glutamine-hydrolyzing) n=1 Tax=Candidatus Litorirhabdus singularis TaxID=2518993 RepID=A0ABT3TG76_9GAMM|nr:asparagine synthase-related protein [Candidatus Litorirhabdus singularis]MCX2981312.1 asparagine synthase [Candidatus Litorirhabdus singularis]
MLNKLDSSFFGFWDNSPRSEAQREAVISSMATEDSKVTCRHYSEKSHLSAGQCASTKNFQDAALTVMCLGSPTWLHQGSSSDSSIHDVANCISKAYLSDNKAFLSDASGEFLVAILDETKNEVVLAVDRFSRRQVYYSETRDGLVFSDSLECLLRHPKIHRVIRPQAIYDYLYFHMVPAPGTIYQDIYKLPAGSYLKFSANTNTCEVKRHWAPEFAESSDSVERLQTDLVPALRSAVDKACKGRDYAKVGAFLSGGLDSSTVSGLLTEISSGLSPALTIGFNEPGYDEVEYARYSAERFDTRLHEYYTNPQDISDIAPLISQSYEEPFGNSSAVPAYCCARMAKEQGIELLLAGDGGDELFAGNERYLKQRVFEYYRILPGLIRDTLLTPIINWLPSSIGLFSKSQSYIEQANVPLPDRLQHRYNFLNREELDGLFTEEFEIQISREHPLQLQRQVFSQPENASTLNRMLYLDWQYTLADNDIRKVSEMCHLAGVEVSYPMLDDEVVDLSCRVPSSAKMQANTLRAFYKNGVRGFLGERTINKGKHGFGLPFGMWMQSNPDLKKMAENAFDGLAKRGIFNSDALARILVLHQDSHASYYGEFVWVLLSLEYWLREYDSKSELPFKIED